MCAVLSLLNTFLTQTNMNSVTAVKCCHNSVELTHRCRSKFHMPLKGSCPAELCVRTITKRDQNLGLIYQ